MNELTIEKLIAAGAAPTQARQWLQPLQQACEQFGIVTVPRQAAFVAQCSAESGGFMHLEEDLYSRRPERLLEVFPSTVKSLSEAQYLVRNPRGLANRVYAHRLGNGDEASGDGWAYRGRGLIQLTGRDNYSDAGVELSQPYLEQPDLVAKPEHAALTAAWFWHTRKCNLLADSAQWDAITRAINGPGMLHATERRVMTDEALRAFA